MLIHKVKIKGLKKERWKESNVPREKKGKIKRIVDDEEEQEELSLSIFIFCFVL